MTDRDLTQLAPDMAELLASGTDLPGPSPEAERRVFARVAATVGIAAGVTAAGAGSASAATGASAGVGAKLIVAVVAVATIGIGGTALYLDHGSDARETEPVRAVVSEPEPSRIPSEDRREAATEAKEPDPEPARILSEDRREAATEAKELPPRPTRAPAPAVASAPPQSSPAIDTLPAERRLLESARAALTDRDAGRALDRLRAHAREFPDGQLAEERDALRIQALVRAGRAADAREQASRFQHAYPRSLYGRSVRAALREIDSDRVTD